MNRGRITFDLEGIETMKNCDLCEGVFLIGTGRGDETHPHCPRCHRSPSGSIDLRGAIVDLQGSVAGVQADLGMIDLPDAGGSPAGRVGRLRSSPAVKRSAQRSVADAYRAAGSKRFGRGVV